MRRKHKWANMSLLLFYDDDAGNWTFYSIYLPPQGELRHVAEKYAILFLRLIMTVSINYVPTQDKLLSAAGQLQGDRDRGTLTWTRNA